MPKQIIPYKYLIPDRYFFKANQKSKLRTYVLRKRIKVFTHKLIKLYLLANYNKKRMYSLFRYNEMCYIIRDTKLIKILFLIIFTKNQLFIKIPSKFDFNYMTEGQEKGKYVFDLNIKTKNFFSVNEEATILSRNYFNSQYKKAYIWGLKREKKNNITSKKIDFNYFNWTLTYHEFLKGVKIRKKIHRGKNVWLNTLISKEIQKLLYIKSSFHNNNSFIIDPRLRQDISLLQINFVRNLYFAQSLIKSGLILINLVQIYLPNIILYPGSTISPIYIIRYFIYYFLKTKIYIKSWIKLLTRRKAIVSKGYILLELNSAYNFEVNYKLLIAVLIKRNFGIIKRITKWKYRKLMFTDTNKST